MHLTLSHTPCLSCILTLSNQLSRTRLNTLQRTLLPPLIPRQTIRLTHPLHAYITFQLFPERIQQPLTTQSLPQHTRHTSHLRAQHHLHIHISILTAHLNTLITRHKHTLSINLAIIINPHIPILSITHADTHLLHSSLHSLILAHLQSTLTVKLSTALINSTINHTRAILFHTLAHHLQQSFITLQRIQMRHTVKLLCRQPRTQSTLPLAQQIQRLRTRMAPAKTAAHNTSHRHRLNPRLSTPQISPKPRQLSKPAIKFLIHTRQTLIQRIDCTRYTIHHRQINRTRNRRRRYSTSLRCIKLGQCWHHPARKRQHRKHTLAHMVRTHLHSSPMSNRIHRSLGINLPHAHSMRPLRSRSLSNLTPLFPLNILKLCHRHRSRTPRSHILIIKTLRRVCNTIRPRPWVNKLCQIHSHISYIRRHVA